MINKFAQLINIQQNTILKTYIVWFFIGIFGVHRLIHLDDKSGKYMLYTNLTAIAVYFVFGMLLAAPIWLGLFIWWAIDSFIMIYWFQKPIQQKK